MADQNPLVRGNKIFSVFEALGGRGAGVVDGQNFGGDECGVEAIGDGVGGDGGDDEPHGVERLAPLKRDGGERAGARE